MITFEFEKSKVNKPSFKDVTVNQFFVDVDGRLSQKMTSNSYAVLALPNGVPFSTHEVAVDKDKPIIKLLPHVFKISFQ